MVKGRKEGRKEKEEWKNERGAGVNCLSKRKGGKKETKRKRRQKKRKLNGGAMEHTQIVGGFIVTLFGGTVGMYESVCLFVVTNITQRRKGGWEGGRGKRQVGNYGDIPDVFRYC